MPIDQPEEFNKLSEDNRKQLLSWTARRELAQWQISTPVWTDDGQVVFAHVRFDSGIKKEFVANLKKYLEYLETTL